MTGYSKYPEAIDDSNSLPLATDNVSEVKAEVVNRLRDANLSQQVELGINPSGTFSDVRSRLDNMDQRISAGGGGSIVGLDVVYGGDTYSNITQLEFAGAGVVVTNPGTGEALVTISAGGGGSPLTVEEDGTPIQSNVTTINFTGDIAVSTPGAGQVDVTISASPNLTVQNNGSNVETQTDLINFTGKAVATSAGSGDVAVEVAQSKIRTYRNTSALAGNTPGNNTTMVWNATSSFVATVNASLGGGNTTLSPSKSGNFLITGKMTFQQTTDAVFGLIIEVLKNGTDILDTVSDYGSVWGEGINRSLNFSTIVDLAASDTISVRWRHDGSVGSATQVMNGESLSWLSFALI